MKKEPSLTGNEAKLFLVKVIPQLVSQSLGQSQLMIFVFCMEARQ